MSNLRDKYKNEIFPALKEGGGYGNPLQIPKIEKVVVNVGVGTKVDRDGLNAAVDEIGKITGQRPLITKARKSISNFRLREGMAVGAKVTLRGVRMYEFLDRLINVALPRIRDFRGISPRAFDGFGNYTIGIREQLIFPEIDYDNIDRIRGLNITIVTSTDSDQESRVMLEGLGFPFRQ